ncbi:MAG: glycosyltransferase family 4 protein [Candidatus Eisenbacteria bacterium]|nr:glycosyltransferase family 4 protein [Candidatus Eisenbacteria bacterium]MBU1947507.1 glycosyltransferase family 4 protein [Candidatus Eisenbacteria bacterium]
MHILYLAQFYNEPTDPGGGRHYAFTRALIGRGHQVTLVTGQENYRTGTISERYTGRLVHREEKEGVTLLRTWVLTGHRRRFALRYINQLSFLLTGLWAGARVKPKPDLIVASSPPLFVGIAGALLSKFHRSPLITDIRDLWPESVVAMGLPVHPLMVKSGYKMARWIYRSSRRMIAVTEGICSGLQKQGKRLDEITLIPNGVDLGIYENIPDAAEAVRDQETAGKFVCIYVGGMGPVHNVGTLVETAARLRDNPKIHFLLIGDGPEKNLLVQKSKEMGLNNVTFRPAVPKQEVPATLASADLCIYSLRNDPFFRGTFPNKNFDYMASGRPLVLAVEGESRRLVEEAGAGFVVTPESADEMADAILRMVSLPPEEREAMGRRGREHVLRHYHRRMLSDRFVDLVESVGAGSRGGNREASASGDRSAFSGRD